MGEVSRTDIRVGPREAALARLTSHPPTLLIQDLRLHMAFLLFTASHSRRWPEGGKGNPTLLRLLVPAFPEAAAHLQASSVPWGESSTMTPRKQTIPTH